MKVKKRSFGVSGWTEEEMRRLTAMVRADVTDRSRFLRRLAMQEWEGRARTKQILERLKTETREEGEVLERMRRVAG